MIATDTQPNGYVPPPEGQPDRERDDLQAMLHSPGWRIFCEHVAEDWGRPEVLTRICAALQNEQYIVAARLSAGKDAIEAVMTWPLNRIHALSLPVRARAAGRPHRRARV
jgi:hypothetical protein